MYLIWIIKQLSTPPSKKKNVGPSGVSALPLGVRRQNIVAPLNFFFNVSYISIQQQQQTPCPWGPF